MNRFLIVLSVEARADILRIHSRSMNLTRGIDLKKIAEKMNGCSGAELKGVCTEAGMYALRERRIHVTQEDFGMHSPTLPFARTKLTQAQTLLPPRCSTSTTTRK